MLRIAITSCETPPKHPTGAPPRRAQRAFYWPSGGEKPSFRVPSGTLTGEKNGQRQPLQNAPQTKSYTESATETLTEVESLPSRNDEASTSIFPAVLWKLHVSKFSSASKFRPICTLSPSITRAVVSL